MHRVDHSLQPRTPGLILRGAFRYDLLVWLATFGRERAARDKMLRLARLAPGDIVLDVGCGTGTLAVMATQRVGPSGAVYGIDASLEMIARATKKARAAGVDVTFQSAAAQALPFPEGHFDAVLSTLMLHHLPRESREACIRDIRRVLKPGGRVLIVDFAASSKREARWLDRLHRRHGHTKLDHIVALLNSAGYDIVESGSAGFRDTQFALARRPRDA